jgi:hypothetical protein
MPTCRQQIDLVFLLSFLKIRKVSYYYEIGIEMEGLYKQIYDKIKIKKTNIHTYTAKKMMMKMMMMKKMMKKTKSGGLMVI